MDAFEQLKQERTNLLSRLSQIEAVLSEHEALQVKVNALLSTGGEFKPSQRMSPTKSGGKPESAGRRVSADIAEFERAMLEVLALSNHPLSRVELYDIAMSRNISVGGQDPLNTLSSRMSRMQGVIGIRGKGYWLQSRISELEDTRPMVEHEIPSKNDDTAAINTSTDLDDLLG